MTRLRKFFKWLGVVVGTAVTIFVLLVVMAFIMQSGPVHCELFGGHWPTPNYSDVMRIEDMLPSASYGAPIEECRGWISFMDDIHFRLHYRIFGI